MNTLKVLHVASFTGNIGDNANHTGFRATLENNLSVNIEYTEYEIREVFWKKKKFDEAFVKLANSHELVVIGGGNYFELWVENSATGTSIDIELDILEMIETPIIFNALGVDPAQGASSSCIKKFRKFLEYCNQRQKILLSCRNDGSIKTLIEIIGKKYADQFYHVPDAGFFTKVKDHHHPELEPSKKNILLQLAGDMIEERFPNEGIDDISYEKFLQGLADYICTINRENVNFIFVPHIFRDLEIIYKLIESLPDEIRRKNVSVAPYLVGNKGQDYIFDLYSKVDLVLGMRFHANVCALGLKTPCIPLINYRQIDELYTELELDNLKVHVNKKGFSEKLLALSKAILNKEVLYPNELLDKWKRKLDAFHQEIAILLRR